MLRFPHLSRKIWLKNRGISNSFKFSTSYQLKNSVELDRKNEYDFKEGDKVHGFVVNEITPIHEMFLTAVKLTHLKTGAEYLHLKRDDSNNVFSVGFRTTPKDSTGLPHILEHLALCGSKKYNCRDPFFKMLRRSLATYMNASTSPDFTCYPFSTQNFQDYKNLQSVYLDSVFNPLLKELDFKQEGWRLEHTDVNNKNTPIIFKGVVYNEMKGVFSDNQNVFMMNLLNSILPSHTYGVVSGGDPLHIPNLKHQDLLNFYSSHYHPSNSRIYSYGNFPLIDHLKLINDEYLDAYDKIDSSSTKVPSEPRWDSPRKKHINCRFDPLIADADRQNSIAIASLCNDITDVQKTFDIYILSQLLLDGPNSAFYKSLVDSNISTGFGPMTGYESQCKDTIFIVNLQGVKAEDFEKIEDIYNQTVINVVKDGFDKKHIDTVLHGIELNVKHQTSNFGLNLLYNLMPIWNHDGNIANLMKINQALQNFKNRIQNDPGYLQSLVEEYLLKNNHKLILTMSPSENYEEKINFVENELLKAKLSNLSKQEVDKIFEDGKILLKEQEKQEDINVLPTLKIQDLKEDVDRYDFKDIEVSNVPVQLAIQPTNGVCYYRTLLNTKNLPEDLKILLPVFNDIVVKMGTENYDYRSWDQEIQLKTGGMNFSNHVVEQKNDSLKYEEGILGFSYCLDQNAGDMFKLWEELFNRVNLTDKKYFETLIKIYAADLTNSITDKGHIYAMSSAASLISPTGKIKESLSGLEFVNRMKSIAQLNDLSGILDQTKEISKFIFNRSCIRSSLNMCNEDKKILKNIEDFYSSLSGVQSKKGIVLTQANPLETANSSVHHVLPYDVNYTSKAILTVPYNHVDHAPLQVLSKLISSLYLHPQVREKGGAYGGGAKLSSDGTFMFYSYRDPNTTRTLDLFDQSCDFILKYNLSDSEIVEAKLGLFQQIDSPVSPGSRGMLHFIHGLTDDDVQSHREKVKNVSKDDILRVAKKYLNPDDKNIKVGRAILGPHNSDVNSRYTENWKILDHEEQSQAQAI